MGNYFELTVEHCWFESGQIVILQAQLIEVIRTTFFQRLSVVSCRCGFCLVTPSFSSHRVGLGQVRPARGQTEGGKFRANGALRETRTFVCLKAAPNRGPVPSKQADGPIPSGLRRAKDTKALAVGSQGGIVRGHKSTTPLIPIMGSLLIKARLVAEPWVPKKGPVPLLFWVWRKSGTEPNLANSGVPKTMTAPCQERVPPLSTLNDPPFGLPAPEEF